MLRQLMLKMAPASVLVALAVAPQIGFTQENSLSSISRLAESQFKTVMTYNQTYSLAGILTTSSAVGPMTKSVSGFGIERNVQQQTVQLFGGMPRALNPDNTANLELTQAKALSRAKTWVEMYGKQSARSMADEIVRAGAGAGIYTYSEEILISRQDLEPITKVLSFIMTVDRSGRATYGAPVLTTPDPDIVYVTYVPNRAGDDFEEDWVLPGAGTLSYQVLDSRGNARTAKVDVNTGGAYDAAVGGSTQAVSCLMDRTNAGCTTPATVPDVRSLMLLYGADMAIVDYTNQLIPVYDEVSGEDGDVEYVPRGAVSYTDRLWNCREYKNTGFYGYVLEVSADRYYASHSADNTVEYTFATRYSSTTVSQVQPFDKSVLAASIPVGARPDQFVISPLQNDTTLLRVGTPETNNISYVAPVRSVGDTSAFNNANASGHSSFRKTSSSGGYDYFYWGTNSNHTHSTGEYRSRLEFDLKSPEDFGVFGIYYQFIDDWGIITVNGIPVSSIPVRGLSDASLANRSAYENFCVNESCGGIAFTQTRTPRTDWTLNTTAAIKAHLGLEQIGTWMCGTAYYPDSESSNQARKCQVDPPRTYSACSPEIDEYTGATYFLCRKEAFCSGGGYTIQMTYTDGRKGCFYGDSGGWEYDYIDLTHALRAGRNVIDLKHIVTRTGHSHVHFKLAGCAAISGYGTGPAPAVPAGGTQSGIESALADRR